MVGRWEDLVWPLMPAEREPNTSDYVGTAEWIGTAINHMGIPLPPVLPCRLDDLHAFNLDTQAWSSIAAAAPEGSPPGALRLQDAALLTAPRASPLLFLHGGYTSTAAGGRVAGQQAALVPNAGMYWLDLAPWARTQPGAMGQAAGPGPLPSQQERLRWVAAAGVNNDTLLLPGWDTLLWSRSSSGGSNITAGALQELFLVVQGGLSR